MLYVNHKIYKKYVTTTFAASLCEALCVFYIISIAERCACCSRVMYCRPRQLRQQCTGALLNATLNALVQRPEYRTCRCTCSRAKLCFQSDHLHLTCNVFAHYMWTRISFQPYALNVSLYSRLFIFPKTRDSTRSLNYNESANSLTLQLVQKHLVEPQSPAVRSFLCSIQSD